MEDFKYNFVEFNNASLALNHLDYAQILDANTNNNLTIDLSALVEGNICVVNNFQSEENTKTISIANNGVFVDSEDNESQSINLRNKEVMYLTCKDAANKKYLYSF